ncbi:DNA mismatch repair protein Msh3 [Capsaspora owczarzaki ATCC 30864]|uniref:DNA mismatch repair protein n=1 Tax=Capsaspora owczarzaki (strain ATCC 30864) TaxID=595528 RepID=A0A0D2USV4_CAPO3|nr:DNA mismatch repair protein Msh3 [Capsaspora owczarzaki ATCC 30864]KJE98041.1 DNA mismatch repair protein Msh3 [Capsaspora owczarzaki ATCC 30864]|eukprot:XP_004342678.2 DNA mismatch repair protein Msh3 [Capsaspora owczarzaki ATCC 30864]
MGKLGALGKLGFSPRKPAAASAQPSILGFVTRTAASTSSNSNSSSSSAPKPSAAARQAAEASDRLAAFQRDNIAQTPPHAPGRSKRPANDSEPDPPTSLNSDASHASPNRGEQTGKSRTRATTRTADSSTNQDDEDAHAIVSTRKRRRVQVDSDDDENDGSDAEFAKPESSSSSESSEDEEEHESDDASHAKSSRRNTKPAKSKPTAALASVAKVLSAFNAPHASAAASGSGGTQRSKKFAEFRVRMDAELEERAEAAASTSAATSTSAKLCTPAAGIAVDEARRLFRLKIAALTPKAAAGNKKAKSPFTQLEQQYIDVKVQHPDAVLFVECGYKFRFFGDDAEIAAKELSIGCFPSHNFMTASIPTHRLPVHVKRLVNLGYKVGVVRQTETAALKAAGDNKSAPFDRKLTGLYTRATLIGDDIEAENDSAEDETGSSHYLMSIFELVAADNSALAAAERHSSPLTPATRIAIVAVRPSTGDIIYDEFSDGLTRSELETRLAHLRPTELILPMQLSTRTEQLIAALAYGGGRSEAEIRLERLPVAQFDYQSAVSDITRFFTASRTKSEAHLRSKSSSHSASEHESSDEHATLMEIDGQATSTTDGAAALNLVLNLSQGIVRCFGALLRYLSDFGLDQVLLLTSNLHHFHQRNHMLLNGLTLSNLEVFRNETDGGSTGTLFALLNHTVTPFGRRLLRTWIAQPLLDRSAILNRQDAIEELLTSEAPMFAKTKKMLQSVGDLDKGLCRIYYQKCSPSEFLMLLHAFNRMSGEFRFWCPPEGTGEVFSTRHSLSRVHAVLLKQICESNIQISDTIAEFVTRLDSKGAKEKHKRSLFVPSQEPRSVTRGKLAIAEVEAQLQQHLREVRKLLGTPSLEYLTVLTEEYLIDVKKPSLKLVPRDWLKMSETKATVRFHSPVVATKLRELNQLREQLDTDCERAWAGMLSEFAQHYDTFRKVVDRLAQLDCLYALAEVAKLDNYVRPVISTEDVALIDVKQGRHPMVDVLLSGQFVPNDVHLHQPSLRCRIVTGPNMGGKSCYIRQVALLAILAQIGSWVPAESARIGIIDAICTRMGAADHIQRGFSTFMVEMQETSRILKDATNRSLVILDELGRGTSTFDGLAIAHATLDYLIAESKPLTLFVTHYPALGEFASTYPRHVSNHHMAFVDNGHTDEEPEDANPPSESDDIQSIAFLYQLANGVAHRSYGLNVARLAGLPHDVLALASRKSAELEKLIKQRSAAKPSLS